MIPAEFSFRRAPIYARFGPIQQIAYVVEDIDASIQHWMQFTGVGPWTVYRNTTMLGHCRGIATTVQMHAALSYQDQMQIELIQVTSRTPSPYQDASGHPLIGMHHIARHSHDLDADIAAAQARGLRTAFSASTGARTEERSVGERGVRKERELEGTCHK